MMQRIKCPACLSVNKKSKYFIEKFIVKQCLGCFSLYVENLPEKDKLKDLYKTEDYYSLPFDSEQRIISENKRRVKQIKKLIPDGKVLDIGCAKGLFLNEIKNSNYETYGIELSAKNVEVCKSNGHQVFHADLDLFYHTYGNKRKFNIITCLDVIEHVAAPQEFLYMISELLENRGLLVLSTPNFSGIVSKLLGKKDPFLIPPEHVNFFSKVGLNKLVQGGGYKIIKAVSFGYITKDGLERTVLNYLPKVFRPLSFCIKPAIDFSIRSLNLFNIGLEIEYYLRK